MWDALLRSDLSCASDACVTQQKRGGVKPWCCAKQSIVVRNDRTRKGLERWTNQLEARSCGVGLAGLLPRHGDNMCRAEGEGPKEDVISVRTMVCARSM